MLPGPDAVRDDPLLADVPLRPSVRIAEACEVAEGAHMIGSHLSSWRS